MFYLILKLPWEGVGGWIRRLKSSVYVNIYSRTTASFTARSAVQSEAVLFSVTDVLLT
jgi:hypothetical protein